MNNPVQLQLLHVLRRIIIMRESQCDSSSTQSINSQSPDNFSLFGQKYEISGTLCNYNIVHSEFQKLAKHSSMDYRTRYRSKGNIKKVLEDFQSEYNSYVNKAVDTAIARLFDNNIYDVDSKRFSKYLENRLVGIRTFNAVRERYDEIVQGEADKDEYRTERRENRGRVVGGGFGLDGYVKGAATAGALNAGMGIAHGVFNLAAKGVSSIGAALNKKELYDSPDIQNALVEAVYLDSFIVHNGLVQVLRNNNFNISPIDQNQIDEAEALYQNIKRPAFPTEKIPESLLKILQMNPYKETYYHFIVDNYWEEVKHLTHIAQYFDIPLDNYKVNQVKMMIQTEKNYQLEELKDLRQEMLLRCDQLFLDKNNDAILEVDILIEEEKESKAKQFYNDLPKESLDALYDGIEKMEQFCLSIDYADGITSYKKLFDTEIRNMKAVMAKKFYNTLPKETVAQLHDLQSEFENYCGQISWNSKDEEYRQILASISKLRKDRVRHLFETLPSNSVSELASLEEGLDNLICSVGLGAGEDLKDRLYTMVVNKKAQRLREFFESLSKEKPEDLFALQLLTTDFIRDSGINDEVTKEKVNSWIIHEKRKRLQNYAKQQAKLYGKNSPNSLENIAAFATAAGIDNYEEALKKDFTDYYSDLTKGMEGISKGLAEGIEDLSKNIAQFSKGLMEGNNTVGDKLKGLFGKKK